jgi:hypothetical protein
MDFSDFRAFWPYYLRQHSKKKTRLWHTAGTVTVFVWLFVAVLLKNAWWVLLAPVTAYGLAWYSHFFIEGNKPATFGHPWWSLRADFTMFWLIVTGKLDEELKRHRIGE